MYMVITSMQLTEVKSKNFNHHLNISAQMNYYERSLELMRQSMEVERKDISQAFKVKTRRTSSWDIRSLG